LYGQNMTSVDMDKLLDPEHRFSVAPLQGALIAQLCEGTTHIKVTGRFKALTSGDLLQIEKKGKDPEMFSNECKLIMDANYLPYTHDMSDAYIRRWFIVPFPNQFKGTHGDIIQSIPQQELCDFLSIIFNRATELLNGAKLTGTPTIDESRAMYESWSNPLKQFIDKGCKPLMGSYIPLDHFKIFFKEYCLSRHYPIPTNYTFNRQLDNLGITKMRIMKIKPQKYYQQLGIKQDSIYFTDDPSQQLTLMDEYYNGWAILDLYIPLDFRRRLEMLKD